MSSLDLERDGQLSSLQMQWQYAYEASINALADYQRVGAEGSVDGNSLRRARERLDEVLAFKTWVALRMKRLENAELGTDHL